MKPRRGPFWPIAAAAFVALLTSRGVTIAQLPAGSVGLGKVVTRFAGTVSLPTPRGRTTLIRVVVQDWYLVRSAKALELPGRGFYLAHLRSGTVVANIAGKSIQRAPGDFWVVDAGVAMTVTIQPRGEAALLQTIDINPQ